MKQRRNPPHRSICHRRFQRGSDFIFIMTGGFVRPLRGLTTRSVYWSYRPQSGL